MTINNVKVSIVCDTYNQEDYIEDALKSFINQKTNFDYEILVHDDASNDNTASIIKEYANRYPDLIKPMIQKENQYSKGVSIMDIQLERAKGKYIAFCEGDDFWTDEHKLQIQYDILEMHPNIDMVAHDVVTIDGKTKEKKGMISPSNRERILTIEEVLLGGGGYLGTNSLFFRKEILFPKPPIRKKLELDYTIQISGALKGGIYFIPKVMSAYRVCAKGSWTREMLKNRNKLIEMQDKIIDMLNFFNDDTDFQYDDTVKETIRKIEFNKAEINDDIKLLKSDKFKDLYNNFSLGKKIKMEIKVFFPFLKKIKTSLVLRGK